MDEKPEKKGPDGPDKAEEAGGAQKAWWTMGGLRAPNSREGQIGTNSAISITLGDEDHGHSGSLYLWGKQVRAWHIMRRANIMCKQLHRALLKSIVMLVPPDSMCIPLRRELACDL